MCKKEEHIEGVPTYSVAISNRLFKERLENQAMRLYNIRDRFDSQLTYKLQLLLLVQYVYDSPHGSFKSKILSLGHIAIQSYRLVTMYNISLL